MIETKQEVLEFLGKINLTEIVRYRAGFSPALRKMYDAGEISDSEIIKGLNSAVICTARVIALDPYLGCLPILDRVENGPQILDYAIISGVFTEKEMDRIRIRGSPEEGLIERLKEELLEPTVNCCTDSPDDEHPACCTFFD